MRNSMTAETKRLGRLTWIMLGSVVAIALFAGCDPSKPNRNQAFYGTQNVGGNIGSHPSLAPQTQSTSTPLNASQQAAQQQALSQGLLGQPLPATLGTLFPGNPQGQGFCQICTSGGLTYNGVPQSAYGNAQATISAPGALRNISGGLVNGGSILSSLLGGGSQGGFYPVPPSQYGAQGAYYSQPTGSGSYANYPGTQPGPWSPAPTLPPYIDADGCSIYNPGFNVVENRYDPNCPDWTEAHHYDNSDAWHEYMTLGQAAHQVQIGQFNLAGQLIAEVNPDPRDPDYQEILNAQSRVVRDNMLKGSQARAIAEEELGDEVAHGIYNLKTPPYYTISNHFENIGNLAQSFVEHGIYNAFEIPLHIIEQILVPLESKMRLLRFQFYGHSSPSAYYQRFGQQTHPHCCRNQFSSAYAGGITP